MWQTDNNKLTKIFTFADFASALNFVNKIGQLAESANHHPDIELSYGKVVVHLSTHETGGVSDKDEKLAKEIDKI